MAGLERGIEGFDGVMWARSSDLFSSAARLVSTLTQRSRTVRKRALGVETDNPPRVSPRSLCNATATPETSRSYRPALTEKPWERKW
ncbi:hypothetical protein CATYP_03520 [Corynebacterium atypicum]|uniref:Uncharacterized protein n=1 Tax=Corynebacterium atypicum TaxID=191610 RepID=A0ABM5QM79_9CORY|nr:hypothetical protein CATYP_03520 [Corynebacterium atypicum]